MREPTIGRRFARRLPCGLLPFMLTRRGCAENLAALRPAAQTADWLFMQKNSAPLQFPYPWRGIAVMMIFLAAAPPVYVAVAAFMGHHFIGGRQILFEIGAVARADIIPSLLPGYSFYMPPVFFAALWTAWRTAQGAALTLGAAVAHMAAAGLACEIFYQFFVALAGGPLRIDVLMVACVQWILSAFVCWLLAAKLGLAKAAAK